MEVQVWWGLGYLIALLTCAKPKLHNVLNMHGSHSLYIGTGHTSADAQRGCAARMRSADALDTGLGPVKSVFFYFLDPVLIDIHGPN